MSGRLAIVLHSHMPYVEGFGTWPFGEEWLWEAIATSYVPLVQRTGPDTPVTLSLTPVLCDQLEAPGALDRCRANQAAERPESHRHNAAAVHRCTARKSSARSSGPGRSAKSRAAIAGTNQS